MEKENKIMCECCRRAEATLKDYRFIESISVSGKVLVCKYCFELSDVEFVEEWTAQV